MSAVHLAPTSMSSEPPTTAWRMTPLQWFVATLAAAAVIAAFLPGLRVMVSTWEQVEEYSYGYFIPVISAFLIWQRSEQLRQRELRGAWTGLPLIVLALALAAIGGLSAMQHFSQYGFVIALFGLSVCFIGWQGTRIVAGPLAVLLLMIPLPQFVMLELSQRLQLLSSELGVMLIRLFGISVFLEGNVIDLGNFKLQVVEACSGLRYLFPLIVLGVLAAYFFKGARWKRATIVLSTIPLTIIINSTRIGLIGVTVEHWGPAMAEGLLHDFEGWFMFMVCIACLVGLMTLLAHVGKHPTSLRSAFGIDYPEPVPKGATVRFRRIAAPAMVASVVLAAVAAVTLSKPAREQIRPQRTPFSQFPMTFDGGWVGRQDKLDRDVLTTLALDDYVLTNYARGNEPPVNFYSAYYATQSTAKSTHSPRQCMPGGGWRITQLKESTVALTGADGKTATSLTLNRAVIERGEQKQLVYYWFNERGRVMTNELAVKWYIISDSVLRSRSDGALLRLATVVAPNEEMAQADQRLTSFLSTIAPRLHDHVPD